MTRINLAEVPVTAADPILPDAERLLIEAAQRDPARFAEVYEAHFDRVYGYIARRTHSRSVAEDLTSEVFLQALATLPRFEWRGVPFAAWLYRMAHNAILDHARKAGREESSDTNERLEAGASAAFSQVRQASDTYEAEGAFADIERRARVAALIDSLPADQRRVIVMRFAEEKSIREIADSIGRSEGAVKQLQFRALANLRSALGG